MSQAFLNFANRALRNLLLGSVVVENVLGDNEKCYSTLLAATSIAVHVDHLVCPLMLSLQLLSTMKSW